MKRKIELALQFSIILVCLIFVANWWNTELSSAQVLCGGEPPIRTNANPISIDALKANMWLPGLSALNKRQITVVIYDTLTDQAAEMNNGIQAWNSSSGCANVNFNTASQAANPIGFPPANTLWIVREDATSQAFPFVDDTNQMIAARIVIYSRWRSSTPNALKKLLSHETGHTFGLLNETFPSQTGNSYGYNGVRYGGGEKGLLSYSKSYANADADSVTHTNSYTNTQSSRRM